MFAISNGHAVGDVPQLRRSRTRFVPALVLLAALVAACGGGDGGDSAGGDGEGTPFEGIGEAASDTGLLQAGSLTATADPGQVVFDVEGERVQFDSADATECVIGEQNLSVFFRTDDGEIRLNGLLLPDGWNLSLSLRPPGQDGVSYEGSLRSGSFGIAGDALSFEGPVNRVEGGDVANASQVDATLAANCESL